MPAIDAPPVVTAPELEDAASVLARWAADLFPTAAGGAGAAALWTLGTGAVYAGVVYAVFKLTVWNDHYGELNPVQFRRWASHLTSGDVVNLSDWTDYATQVVMKARASAHRIAAAPAEEDVLDVSPQQALVAQLAELGYIVAKIATWRRGHRANVHIPEVRAWTDLAASLGALEATVGALSDADAHAWHQLQVVALPHLRTRLEGLITGVRGDIQSFKSRVTTQVVPHLQAEIDDDLERIHRINTVTIPHLLQLHDAETQARTRGDVRLERGISEEADTRTHADLSILAQVAPLTAWFSGIGRQTTTKVNKLEAPLDRFLSSDLNWLAALAMPPALLELVTKITGRVAFAIPEALAGIEEAAAKVVGVI